MDRQSLVTVVLLLAGTIGGFLSKLMPASGKAAVGLGLFPLLGTWLATEFC